MTGRFAALALAAGFAIAIAPVALPGFAFAARDHTIVFLRLFHVLVEAYSRGELPLWDPHVGLGEPLAAYPACTAWSPLLAIFALPGSLSTRYDLFIVAHFVLAAGSMRVLAREVGASPAGAWVAAAVYALCGVILSLNSLVPGLLFAALAPLVLALALRILDAPTPGRFIGLTLATALLGTVALVEFALSTVVVFVALAAPRVRAAPQALRRIAVLGLAGITAVALAAPAILLVFDLLAGSTRGSGFPYDAATEWSLAAAGLLDLFLPGSTASDQAFLDSLYFGPAALALAAAGTRGRALLLAAAALFVLLALGPATPIHRWAHDSLPLMSATRFPVKYLFGVALVVAICAGHGFDALRGPVARRGAQSALVITGLALALAAWAGSPHAAVSALATAFAVATAGGLLRSSAPDRSSALMAAIVAIDLGVAGTAVIHLADSDALAPPPLVEALVADAPAPVLFAYNHRVFRAARSPEIFPTLEDALRFEAAFIEPWVGVPLGVRYAFDLDPNATRPLPWKSFALGLPRVGEAARIRALGRLGVTHLLVEANVREAPGLEFVAAEPPITLFRLRERRPFLSAPRETLRVADADEAFAVVTSTAAPFDRVVLEGAGPERAAGRVELRSRTPNELRFVASSSTGFVAVVAQSFDPGWRAELVADRRALPTMRAEGLLTGIAIPAGVHEVALRYRPRALAAGLPASAAAIVALLGVAVFGFARRRRARR